jgi:hypothetical protein
MIRVPAGLVAIALSTLAPGIAPAETPPHRIVAGTALGDDALIWALEIDATLSGAGITAGPSNATAEDLRRSREQGADHEASFDLPSALRALHGACCSIRPAGDDVPAWLEWEAACDDAIRIAWGIEDEAALEQALSALLRARPGRELHAGRFAEGARIEAASLAARQQTGSLGVAGLGQSVWLDGRPLGLAPLLVPGIPAGAHRLTCGDHTLDIEVSADTGAAISCPPPPAVTGATALGAHLGAGQAAVVLAAGDADRMDPGTWVFWSNEHVTGLLVGAPGRAAEGLDQVRTLRVR